MSLENSPTKQGFRTYIGLRYVPKIIGVWDNTKEYEALSIVVYEGNSYTSKMIVPIGVDIHNEQYWVMTGNYNAQVANLSNQVEVAVRQILDYATDFEKFKTDMMKLYNDFTVYADGKIEDKLEEVEKKLTIRYEAFQSFVTEALEQYRSEMHSFTTDTQTKYTAFMDNANNTIAAGLASISSDVHNRQIDFENRLNQSYSNLETEVNNLVVESGNPEATSAEITTARGSYPTLAARLNGMENLAPFTHKVTAPTSGELDLNTYTTVGIYTNNSGGVTLLNSPVPSPAEFMLFVMNNSASVVQLFFATNFGNNGFMESMYMRTKFRTGVWSNWFTVAQGNNNVRIERNTEATGTFDFNNATTHACVMYTADNIQGYTNGPTTLVEPTDFMLQTIQVSNGNEYIGTTIQICIFGVENEMWLRQKVVDVWTNWTKLSADSDVSNLRQQFETFKTSTVAILSEVKPQVDVNTKAISNIRGRLETAEGDISDLKNNVNSVTANVNSLYGDVSTLQGDVQSLQTDVSTKVNNFERIAEGTTVDLTELNSENFFSTRTLYTLRLDSNTLYSGQPMGEEVKMLVYALGTNQRVQMFFSETGKVYKRVCNNGTWSAIEEVVDENIGNLETSVQDLYEIADNKVNNREATTEIDAIDLTTLNSSDYLRTDTVYTLRLANGTLYSGQRRGEEVKMFVYALGVNQRSQVFISETGKVYKRNYNYGSWTDIEEVSGGDDYNIVEVDNTGVMWIRMANKKYSIKVVNDTSVTPNRLKIGGVYTYDMSTLLIDGFKNNNILNDFADGTTAVNIAEIFLDGNNSIGLNTPSTYVAKTISILNNYSMTGECYCYERIYINDNIEYNISYVGENTTISFYNALEWDIKNIIYTDTGFGRITSGNGETFNTQPICVANNLILKISYNPIFVNSEIHPMGIGFAFNSNNLEAYTLAESPALLAPGIRGGTNLSMIFDLW